MKKILILLPILFMGYIAVAQLESGKWKAELDVQGQKLPLELKFEKAEIGYSGKMDSPDQGAFGIPLQKVKYDDATKAISFEVAEIMMTYSGKLSTDNAMIDGIFKQGEFSTGLVFKRMAENKGKENENRPQEPKAPFNYLVEDIEFLNDQQKVNLGGTLTLPNKDRTKPIVVMISGSGAQDRNSELFGHKPFWVIADYLANNGIGSLRYDDRGVGKSTQGNVAEPTTMDLATDVEAAVAFLRNQGYTNIGLMGHSEGGSIAGIVAAKDPKLNFAIMLSAPAIAGSELIPLQIANMSKLSEDSEEIANANLLLGKAAIDFTTSYQGTDFKNDFKEKMNSVIGQLPADYQNNKEVIISSISEVYGNKWYQEFLKYDPMTAYKSLTLPTLAIFGTKDFQVPYPGSYDKFEMLKAQRSNNNLELYKFENLNHLLQPSESGGLEEYGKIKQTIAPVVLQTMRDFILKYSK